MSDLDLYRATILEEASHPVNRGKLADYDLTYRYRNASCGDLFTVFIKLDETKSLITTIGWEGEGCVISIAAMSLVSQQLANKTLEEVAGITHQDIGRWLGIDLISPGRIACVAIGLRTVQKAINSATSQTQPCSV